MNIHVAFIIVSSVSIAGNLFIFAQLHRMSRSFDEVVRILDRLERTP